MEKSFSFIILTSHCRNTDVCMNHIEVLMEYKYMQKKPDPGLNYTECATQLVGLPFNMMYNSGSGKALLRCFT